MNISLEKIIINAGTQSRAKIDENVVADYADKMNDGVEFPPVVVFHDGAQYFLADGFHRYFARKRIGSPGITCDVHEGTLRDAVLFSFSANKAHGLPPNSADKRKAVTTMITDIEWQDWSDRVIARICGVSHTLVQNMRKELGATKAVTKMTMRGKETTRIQQPTEKEEEQQAEMSEADIHAETMKFAVQELQKQNEELQDQLTVAMASSTDDIQKEKAESIIKDLRAQIRVLEIELKAVKNSRDQFQAENAQLMKQVQMLQKKLKKLEG
jgi:hypothetical protein